MNKKNLVLFAVALTLISGCQTTNMTKEDWGKTIGGVGGAVLGASVSSGKNKWLGAAIGGAIGYFAGQMIGRHLDEEDRKALAAKTVHSLDQEKSGTTTWKSNRSNASAQIKTGDITYTNQSMMVKRLKNVESVPSIKLEKKEYQTTSFLRVRTGPGTSYKSITTLKPGDVVTSAGRTDNGWLMLAKQDVTIGYVHGNYVKAHNPVETAMKEGVDLDSVEIKDRSEQQAFAGIDLDAIETTTSTVDVKTGCRDVEISVNTDKGLETETTRACQQADGVWELG